MQNAIPFGPPGGAGAQAQMQQPTPAQIQAMQQQFVAEAQRQGLTPQQFAEKIRAAQMQAAIQAQQKQQQQSGAQSEEQAGNEESKPAQAPPQPQSSNGPQPIQPGPPKPEAIAVAKFLKSQTLKSRPCILSEKRKEMFKVKRAIRALQSPAYQKARTKNKLLPEVNDRASAESVFKLLPLSMLAIRVERISPENNPGHGQPGHQHGATKGKKGQPWLVRIEQHQDTADHLHYVWFYEGSQWMQKLYAAGALAAVIAVVLFPLWPYFMRRGVWYLSMGCLGLLGAFFGLAIVRLIFFLFSLVAIPPGIWIYPNLFEDVGFFDSFKPMWAWRETKESLAVKKAERKQKRKDKKAKREMKANGDHPAETPGQAAQVEETGESEAQAEPIALGTRDATTASGADAGHGGQLTERSLKATVEEEEE